MNPVIQWHNAGDHPLAPRAAYATGSLARTLLDCLHSLDPAVREILSVTATRDTLIVIDPSQAGENLPWLNGIRYAAPHPQAASLWIPTHRAPTAPADLLETALLKRVGKGPLLLWDEPEQILPLHATQRATPAVLAWLAEVME